MDTYDDDDDFYEDMYYFEDLNLHLPNYFITCFSPEQLNVFRQAIGKYAEKYPQHNMDIDTSGSWNKLKDPALLCYDRGELTEFWKILESIRNTAI